MLEKPHSLSDYLRSQQAAILAKWRELAKRDASLAHTASSLSYQAFLDQVPHFLDVFCGYLESSGNRDALNEAREVVRTHGRERWKQDFNLEELLRDWGSLNQAVLDAVNRFYDETPQGEDDGRADAIRKTSSFFTEAICASVVRFSELQRAEALTKIDELEQMRGYFEQIADARRRFLSEVSHDIGGSLTAISGVSELLKDGAVADDESSSSEFGGIIDESVLAATKLLDTILQLTHFDAAQVQFEAEPVQIGDFLSDSARTLASQRGVEISFQSELPAGFEVMADPAKLQRTLEIIFDYAKADSCGSATLSLRRLDEDSWGLEFRFHRLPDPTADCVSAVEHRRELDRLLIKRYCLIQKASCEIGDASESDGGISISARFLV